MDIPAESLGKDLILTAYKYMGRILVLVVPRTTLCSSCDTGDLCLVDAFYLSDNAVNSMSTLYHETRVIAH